MRAISGHRRRPGARERYRIEPTKVGSSRMSSSGSCASVSARQRPARSPRERSFTRAFIRKLRWPITLRKTFPSTVDKIAIEIRRFCVRSSNRKVDVPPSGNRCAVLPPLAMREYLSQNGAGAARRLHQSQQHPDGRRLARTVAPRKAKTLLRGTSRSGLSTVGLLPKYRVKSRV